MNDADQIASLHFDGAALAPAERLTAFRQLTPGYDVVLPLNQSPADFFIESRAWMLETLVLHTSVISAVEISRTADHILRDRRNTYSFILLKHGGWRGELDEGAVQVGSGQVTIMDFARTWRVIGTDQENVMLVVPRETVDALAPNAPPLHGRTFDGASGRLFAEHLLALTRHLPAMTADEVSLIREATLALMANALASLSRKERAASRPLPAPVARVRAYVEERLTSPQLCVDAICRDLAVTRATLYRSFVAGGIAGYIRRRRLEAAHARISDPAETASVVEIAELYCFSSHAHFSTAFRNCFGYTPRDARRAPASVTKAGAVFSRWQAVLDPL